MVLPAEGCRQAAPVWPLGKPSTAESTLWKRLWALRVAQAKLDESLKTLEAEPVPA